MRTALAAAGARLLEAVLAGDGDGYAGPHVKCGAGHQASYAGRRPKTVSTVLGPVQVMRAWYHSHVSEFGGELGVWLAGVTEKNCGAHDLLVTGVVGQHRRCLLHHRLPGVSADAAA